MSRKKDKNESMQLLLQHYGLSKPLDQKVQARMAADYEKIYKNVLKKTAKPAVLSGILTAIYFLIKKAGLPVSLVKAGTVIMLSAALGTGTYLAVKSPVNTVPSVAPTVMVRPFTTASLDRDTGLLVAEKLSESLNAHSGEGYAGIVTGTAIKGSKWTIFGTVEKIDGRIVIITKIIDPSTSRLNLIIEEKCKSMDDIDRAVKAIIKKMPPLKN